MIQANAVLTVLGFLGVLVWTYLGITSSAVEGKQDLDPEARYGANGRRVVAGVLGFGLGGMSASFAGWASGPAVLAAIGGAALMIVAAQYLGFEDEPEDPA